MNEIIAVLKVHLPGTVTVKGDGVKIRKKVKKLKYNNEVLFSSSKGVVKYPSEYQEILARVPVKQRKTHSFYNDCYRLQNLTEEAISYWISNDACPDKRNKRTEQVAYRWKKMTDVERLRFYLGEISEGNEFSIEFL